MLAVGPVTFIFPYIPRTPLLYPKILKGDLLLYEDMLRRYELQILFVFQAVVFSTEVCTLRSL
jgi:hypothetical protein